MLLKFDFADRDILLNFYLPVSQDRALELNFSLTFRRFGVFTCSDAVDLEVIDRFDRMAVLVHSSPTSIKMQNLFLLF